MTKHEGAVLSAYTGILLTDFQTFHAYAEEILCRPILIHEFLFKSVKEELRTKSGADFEQIMRDQK